MITLHPSAELRVRTISSDLESHPTLQAVSHFPKIGFCSMSSRVTGQHYKLPTESYIKDNSLACETFGNNLHTVKKLLEQFMIISITWWDSLASQLL